jgi:hypothetical protein
MRTSKIIGLKVLQNEHFRKNPGGRGHSLPRHYHCLSSPLFFGDPPICPLRGGRLMSQNEWLPPDAAPLYGHCASRNSRLSRKMS